MTAIPKYSEREFHNKVWELAKLGDPFVSAVIVPGTNDLVCKSWPVPKADAWKIAFFINQFFKENKKYVKFIDLDAIKKIIRYLKTVPYPIITKRVQALYDRCNAASVPFLMLPPEIVQQVVQDQETYLVLRQVCRAHNQVLPIERACVQPLYETDCLHSTGLFVYSLLGLLEDGEIEKARYCLQHFLCKTPREVQENFWLLFSSHGKKLFLSLFKNPYSGISSCALAASSLDPDWISLFPCVIAAFPDLTHLSIRTYCKGTFPVSLLTSIMKCNKLQVLDISTFALSNQQKTFLALATHPSLQTLYVQLSASDETLELPKEFYPKLHGLYFRPKDDRTSGKSYPTQDSITSLTFYEDPKAQALIARCPHIRRFRVNSSQTLQSIPPHVEELEIVLPVEDVQAKLKAPFEQVCQKLTSLKKVAFFLPEHAREVRLQDFDSVLQQLPELESLQALQLMPQVHSTENHWLNTVCQAKRLRHLACRISHRPYELQKLSLLCQQLDSLSLCVDFTKKYIPCTFDFNYASKLTRLSLEVIISKDESDLIALLEPLLSVCNPKELMFIAFYNNQYNEIGKISITATAQDGKRHVALDSLSKFPRLSHVIFDDASDELSFDDDFKYCIVSEMHPLGVPFSGCSIRLPISH